MADIASSTNRRRFLGATAATGVGLSLLHLEWACSPGISPSPDAPPPHRGEVTFNSWDDIYRNRWSWDRVAKGAHGWLNCRSTCTFDLFIKDNIILREEQSGTYEASRPDLPDFNPRGCQKGACYSSLMYGPNRLRVPLKRVGERGSGQWEPVSWDDALRDIATRLVDIIEREGAEAIFHDLGPHFDQGATTLGRVRFFHLLGAAMADDWAEIGDLNVGATMTLGFPHVGGTSDEWFLSDCLVVWTMNPSVTQIPDAHFLFEARYRGAKLIVIAPEYSATAIHADTWLPIKPGADAALALAAAHLIIENRAYDEPYILEQTDLPLLVRLDNQAFLRASDLDADADRDRFVVWDQSIASPTDVAGPESGSLKLGDVKPQLEGRWSIKLATGQSVEVTTVFSLLRAKLQDYTPDKAAALTGLSPEAIRAFAHDLSVAQRPLILSSWGSNRYFHSDLMNRAKILLASLRGSIGREGGGFFVTGWFSMEGFEIGSMMKHAGTRGVASTLLRRDRARKILRHAWQIATFQKTLNTASHEVFRDMMGIEDHMTNSASVNYAHGGIRDELNAAVALDGTFPASLASYVEEAQQKGWMPLYPQPGKEIKAWFTGGNNVLRRTNMYPRLRDGAWQKMELIVDVNFKATYTGMYADYLLPAAGYYEKPNIKYPVAFTPYLHYGDAAVKPIGESRDEWWIYSRLAQEITQIARERKVAPYKVGTHEVELDSFADLYGFDSHYGPDDAEGVTQQVLDLGWATMGMDVEDLKRDGIAKYNSTGYTMPQSQLYNRQWRGKGPLTACTDMVEEKYPWPTETGRQQFYIDHRWFIDSGESLPGHKPSPAVGGQQPLQFVSCHARWSVHSVWRDQPMLLRLQRGVPLVYLNPDDAAARGIADHDLVRIHNEHGQCRMWAKVTSVIQPGMAFYYHAWEPHQFPNHESYKCLTPGPMKPLHFAGGQRQLGWMFAIYEPGQHVQDTRVQIERDTTTAI